MNQAPQFQGYITPVKFLQLPSAESIDAESNPWKAKLPQRKHASGEISDDVDSARPNKIRQIVVRLAILRFGNNTANVINDLDVNPQVWPLGVQSTRASF